MRPDEIIARLASTGTPPNHESILNLSVGLEKTIHIFKTETIPFIKDGGSELRFVYAPYGRGKTHLLRTLQLVASKMGLVTAFVDCNWGQAPFATLSDTYRAIANNLLPTKQSKEFIARLGVDAVIEEAVSSCDFETGKRRVKTVFKDPHLSCEFRNLAAAYGKLILQERHSESPGVELQSLLRSNVSSRVRVSDLYRMDSKLPRPIGKLARRNAAAWLRSIASLPVSLGYPGLAIFFDETEQNLSFSRASPKKRRIHLANLRNFIDHMALGSFKGCVIHYAVVEEFLEVAKTELEALSQRIERIRIGKEGELSNPRAVWVDLDELTNPSPGNEVFFTKLGKNILHIGEEAGLTNSSVIKIEKSLNDLGAQFCKSISTGAVREFVKTIASHVAMEIPN